MFDGFGNKQAIFINLNACTSSVVGFTRHLVIYVGERLLQERENDAQKHLA